MYNYITVHLSEEKNLRSRNVSLLIIHDVWLLIKYKV